MQFLSRALCAAILLTSTAAHAYETIHEAQGFTLGRSEFDPEVPVWLISETASTVKFSLWGMAEGLQTSTDSSYQQWSNDYKAAQGFYGINVKNGYAITGITVTGTFTGSLEPAQWTMPGGANNHLGFGFSAGALSDFTSAIDVDGQQSFTLTTGPAALQGEFGLSFNGTSESSAASVWYYDEVWGDQYWLGSQAMAGVGNLVMTVNVSAVPEPATYGMLFAGLGLLAVAARRQRR